MKVQRIANYDNKYLSNKTQKSNSNPNFGLTTVNYNASNIGEVVDPTALKGVLAFFNKCREALFPDKSLNLKIFRADDGRTHVLARDAQSGCYCVGTSAVDNKPIAAKEAIAKALNGLSAKQKPPSTGLPVV